jgi:hypothetical protein
MPASHGTHGRRPRSAPFGIKLLCALGAVRLVRGVPTAVGALTGGPVGVATGLLLLALLGLRAATLYGLWTLQPWAWWGTIVVFGAGSVVCFLGFLSTPGGLGPLLVDVGILAYVAGQREVFRRQARSGW